MGDRRAALPDPSGARIPSDIKTESTNIGRIVGGWSHGPSGEWMAQSQYQRYLVGYLLERKIFNATDPNTFFNDDTPLEKTILIQQSNLDVHGAWIEYGMPDGAFENYLLSNAASPINSIPHFPTAGTANIIGRRRGGMIPMWNQFERIQIVYINDSGLDIFPENLGYTKWMLSSDSSFKKQCLEDGEVALSSQQDFWASSCSKIARIYPLTRTLQELKVTLSSLKQNAFKIRIILKPWNQVFFAYLNEVTPMYPSYMNYVVSDNRQNATNFRATTRAVQLGFPTGTMANPKPTFSYFRLVIVGPKRSSADVIADKQVLAMGMSFIDGVPSVHDVIVRANTKTLTATGEPNVWTNGTLNAAFTFAGLYGRVNGIILAVEFESNYNIRTFTPSGPAGFTAESQLATKYGDGGPGVFFRNALFTCRPQPMVTIGIQSKPFTITSTAFEMNWMSLSLFSNNNVSTRLLPSITGHMGNITQNVGSGDTTATDRCFEITRRISSVQQLVYAFDGNVSRTPAHNYFNRLFYGFAFNYSEVAAIQGIDVGYLVVNNDLEFRIANLENPNSNTGFLSQLVNADYSYLLSPSGTASGTLRSFPYAEDTRQIRMRVLVLQQQVFTYSINNLTRRILTAGPTL